MKSARTIISLIWLAAMLLVYNPPSFAAGDDVITIKGENLTENEMTHTRGGFSLDDGSFMTFSMDFLKMNLSLDNKMELPETFFNAVSQRAIITDQGMQYDLKILKGGSIYEIYSGDQAATIIDQDIVNINDSFKNISGLSNIGIIAGDGNTMVNSMMLKVDIGYYGVKEISSFNAFNFMRQ